MTTNEYNLRGYRTKEIEERYPDCKHEAVIQEFKERFGPDFWKSGSFDEKRRVLHNEHVRRLNQAALLCKLEDKL